MEMTGAQILVEGMLREGVEKLFGYAGATICPLADVLRNTPQLDYTLVRNEQNAAHMASAMPEFLEKQAFVSSLPALEPQTSSQALLLPTWTPFPWWPSPGSGTLPPAGAGYLPGSGHHRRCLRFLQAQLSGQGRGRAAPDHQ